MTLLLMHVEPTKITKQMLQTIFESNFHIEKTLTLYAFWSPLWIHGIEFDFWSIIVMMNILDQKRRLVVRTFNAFNDTHKRQQVVMVTPHDWKMTFPNMSSCFNMRWTLVPMHMNHIFVLKVMLHTWISLHIYGNNSSK